MRIGIHFFCLAVCMYNRDGLNHIHVIVHPNVYNVFIYAYIWVILNKVALHLNCPIFVEYHIEYELQNRTSSLFVKQVMMSQIQIFSVL